MRKIVFIGLLSLIFFNRNFAQKVEWAKIAGAGAYDYGYGICGDKYGNIYAVGKIEDSPRFGDTTLPKVRNHDAFVAKYTPEGKLSWIRTAGGKFGDYAHAVACDNKYVYVCGEVEDYGPFNFDTLKLYGYGGNDIFVAKYDLDGNLLWAVDAGSAESDKPNGITYDAQGNIYITGHFSETAKFGNLSITASSGRDAFIAKYNPNGVIQWLRKGAGGGTDVGLGIKADTEGNIYVCGVASGYSTFNTTKLSGPGGANAFLAKYNSSGDLLWIKSAGGYGHDEAWGVALDTHGRVFIAGEYSGTAKFDGLSIKSSEGTDAFVACYTTAGAAVWASSCGGSGIDRAKGLGCDDDNVYITGQYGFTAFFGSQKFTAADTSDVFISRLNKDGQFKWTMVMRGGRESLDDLGYEAGNAIFADNTGDVYVTGSLLNGGSLAGIDLPPYARTDIFITRISQSGFPNVHKTPGSDKPADSDSTIISINNLEMNGEDLKIWPNPNKGHFTLNFSFPSHDIKEVIVFNTLGQVVMKKSTVENDIDLNLSNAPKGFYILQVNVTGKKYNSKLVID
jgi:hypothetical protein